MVAPVENHDFQPDIFSILPRDFETECCTFNNRFAINLQPENFGV